MNKQLMNKNNRKSVKETQQFVKIYKSVLSIFGEIQDASSLSKSQVMDLVKVHKQNAFYFDKAFQQTYLKIFKCFHQRANKKIPTKFETVADLLFKQLMKNQSPESTTSLNEFCDLLSEAIFSSIMNVRIMASRIMFLVLKGLPNAKVLNVFLTEKTQSGIGKAVLFLVKQKVSTYRQLGIKLSSLILVLKKSDSNSLIENQLFKILSTQDNEMIRKMVMTNIPFNQQNIDKILVRLRDKNSEIRATLLRRLVTENFKLESLKLNNIYKLLYDGYGTKDVICKEEALRYFASYFKEGEMDPQNKFENFVQLFQPNLLLVNSHLYILFNRLLGQLMGYLPVKYMCEYVMRLCNKVKSLLKDKAISVSNQLIWLKNSSICKPQTKQINNAFEEYSPSGTQFAELLRFFLEKRNIFAMNEFLQMFTNIKMPDEIGRNRMFDTLRETLKKMGKFEIQFNLNDIRADDDICNVQKQDQIKLKKCMLSYYDIPIISNSMDLIYPIISAMKVLRPESFVHQLQQTLSDFENPDEYSVFKEKTTLQLTLKTLIGQSADKDKNKAKLQIIQEKLQKINEQITILKQKTLSSVIALSKIQHNWNFDAYMPMIKDQLAKKDASHGIYLLGLYCLQSVQKVKLFFPIFWHNIMDEPDVDDTAEQRQQYKLNLMISLKIVTDFIVKFNILNSENVMNNTSTDETTDYNSDSFMEKITRLILHKDSDIRIFSIECLCRMIYHNRVDDNNISTYFLYLLLLWWETNALEVSAKSVHTISLFFRSYIEKGNEQVKKLAQMLCIFHKILLIFLEKNKTINKQLIVYNLKINEFIKKTVSIATTVLKYHKQKKTIWNYEQPEIGPQQFFLLYLLYEPGFQNMLQRPLNVCDFYIKCPLQTLIFVKKKTQRFVQLVQQGEFFPSSYRHDRTVTKKSLQEVGRFEKQIESYISVKNEETFNQEIIKTLEKIFAESSKYVNEEAKRIAKNIEDAEIFIDIDSDFEDNEDNLYEEMEQSEPENEQEHSNECNSVSQIASQSVSQHSSQRSDQKSSQSVRVIKIEPRNVNNHKNKRPVIEQIQSDQQSDKQSQHDPDEVEEIQMKPVDKRRKRAPANNNLVPKKQFHIEVSKPTQRVTRSRKPIL